MTRRELLAAAAALPLMRAGQAPRVPTFLLGPRPGEGGCAMPYSGGLVSDGVELRLYYLSNFRDLSLAATSLAHFSKFPDPAAWSRGDPVLRPGGAVDAISVARGGDPRDPYPWKALVTAPGRGPARFFFSRDGLAWLEVDAPRDLLVGDRSSLAWFRGSWLLLARAAGDPRRFSLWAGASIATLSLVAEDWLRADRLDGPDAQLYGVDLLDQEGRLALTIFRGQAAGRPKLNVVVLARLRGDLSVERGSFSPVAVPGPAGSWCFGNVQGVGGGLVGGRLIVSGRAGDGRGGNGLCATGYVEL